MSEPSILQERDGYVLRLVMNRPEAKNAFNNEMYLRMAAAIRDASKDPQTRVLVITGSGDAFSAGQDLAEMTQIFENEAEVGFEHLVDALTGCDKPILTAVNGIGVGIGCTMLLHTDLNYIAQGARLRCPFVPLGVVPEAGSSFLLPHVIGEQRTAEFFFTGRWLSSSEVVAFGIALEEVAAETLLDAVMNVARQIAKQPPEALRATKRLMRHALQVPTKAARDRENDEFARRLGSPENNEAISAFFEKREPKFD